MVRRLPQRLKPFLLALSWVTGGVAVIWIGDQAAIWPLSSTMAAHLAPVNQWITANGPPSARAIQGESLFLNDQAVPVPWQRRGDRLGLADVPLMQHLGIGLADTQIAGLQPIRWFTERPQNLASWHAGGFRYLDVTELAQQAGWQWRLQGDQLHLETPPSRVLGANHSRHGWGERLTLQLDRPTLWILEEETSTFTVTLQASADATLHQAILAGENRWSQGQPFFIRSYQAGRRGHLQLQAAVAPFMRPRVWSVPNPDRVVIDLTTAPLTPRDIRWAPDLQWRENYYTVGPHVFPVHQLWLQPSPRQALQAVWPSTAQLPGLAPLVKTARDHTVAAAINGGFFNRNNQLPLGAIRRDRRWISGPILGRGTLTWDNRGTVTIDRLRLTQQLVTPQGTWSVDQINSGYVQAGISLYTLDWGPTYTPITDNEILMAVHQGQAQPQVRTGAAGHGRYPIPTEGFLLVFRSYQTAAQQVLADTTVEVLQTVHPQALETVDNALGAGPVLVRNGQSVVDPGSEQFSPAFAKQAAPRSIVGITPDDQIVLVAIYLDRTGRGPTLQEAAQVMLKLGMKHALNLDGGNSSSLYLGGSLINRPATTAGRVHSGLGIVFTNEFSGAD